MIKEITITGKNGKTITFSVDIPSDWNTMDEVMPDEPEGTHTEYIVAVASSVDLDYKKVVIDYDIAFYTWVIYSNGKKELELIPSNDWDEGQPWGIIAWKELPKLPSIC